MQLNGFADPVKYQFIHADVKQYLQKLSPGSFGIIIMDPPTFSNSKRMDDILDIQKDHVFLVNQCIELLQPGGTLYFSTNYRQFLLDNEKIHTKSIQDITKPTTPFDFEGRFSRYCFRIERV
jgi:23S rRNA (cytosine1962-C5)-methyltransferase